MKPGGAEVTGNIAITPPIDIRGNNDIVSNDKIRLATEITAAAAQFAQNLAQAREEFKDDPELSAMVDEMMGMISTPLSERQAPKKRLLAEAKGVSRTKDGVTIEIKQHDVKDVFIGPDGRSKAGQLFDALSGSSTVTTDEINKKDGEIKEIEIAALGGIKAGVNMKVSLERVAKDKKPKEKSKTDIDIITFRPISGAKQASREVAIRIERTENNTGVPHAKVFLDVKQPKNDYKFGSEVRNLAGVQEELNELDQLLTVTATATGDAIEKQREGWANKKVQLTESLSKEQYRDNSLEIQQQTERDISNVLGLVIERQNILANSLEGGAPINDQIRGDLEMLASARKILETPANLLNPRKPEEQIPTNPGLQDLIKKVAQTPESSANGNRKANAQNELNQDGVVQPLPVTETDSNLEQTPISEKTKEELIAEFDKELETLKGLHEQREELEAKIAELEKGGTEVLSKADKEKLSELKSELEDTNLRLEVVSKLGEMELLNLASNRSKKLGEEVISSEDLMKLSPSRLYVLLQANYDALGKQLDKAKDEAKVPIKEKLHDLELVLSTLKEIDGEAGNLKKNKEYKDKAGIIVLTEWLADQKTSQEEIITKMETEFAQAESNTAQNETLIAELKKQLEEVNKQIAESELKAQAIIAALAGKMGTEEWLVLVAKLQDAHGGKFEDGEPDPEAAQEEAAANGNAALASNCIRKIDLELEQRAEPETSKVKKFFKRAAEVLTSVFGGIAARTAVKAVLVGSLGVALGGPAGLAIGAAVGALAGGASSAIFSTWMHYKVFHNDKAHAVYTENANPGRMDVFKKRIHEKANEIYNVQGRMQNVSQVYNAIASGQMTPNQLNDEQRAQILGVVTDARFLKRTTNYIGVNNLNLPADMFVGENGQPLAIEDALRDFATRFDNFVNAAINAGQLDEATVAQNLESAEADAKQKVDQVITAASWTKFFKGAMIGGMAGFISQGISNSLEGQGFFGTHAAGNATGAEAATSGQIDLTDKQIAEINTKGLEIAGRHGQEQAQYLESTYNMTEAQAHNVLTYADADGNGLLEGAEIDKLHEVLQGNFGSIDTTTVGSQQIEVLKDQFGMTESQAGNMLTYADADGNGILSGAELDTLKDQLATNFGGGIGGTGESITLTNWDVPDTGNISSAVPQEWVETWTKGIQDVGRGHDFHGAMFDMSYPHNSHEYALAKALDYMQQHAPVENMNTEEAGIMTSHLYGYILTDTNKVYTDADIQGLVGRVVEKYAGTEHDMGSLFANASSVAGTGGGSNIDTVVQSLTEISSGTAAILPMDGIYTASQGASYEFYNLVNGYLAEQAPTTAQTVANGIGETIVDATRSVSKLGTSGALAGMGLAMWAGNMYTPENREFGNKGTGTGTGDGTATPGAATPGTDQATTTTQSDENTDGEGPTTPTSEEATINPPSETPGATQVTTKTVEGVGIKPLGQGGNELSTDVNSGRLVAPAVTWRDQSGELSSFAIKHGKLNALRVVGLKVAHGAWEAASAAFRGRNPFRQQFYDEVLKSVKVNNSLAVLDTHRNVVTEQAFSTTGLRGEEMELAVGKQIAEMRNDIRRHLKNYIGQALDIEFGSGANTLTSAEGRDQVHKSDMKAIEMFLKDPKKTKVNDEMLDSFMNLMIVLNDPANYNENASKMTAKGQSEFQAIAQLMLDREKQWMAILPGKVSAKANTKYRGMPLVVSDAIIRASLELSGFTLTDEMRRSAQYFTNVDQMTRSAGMLDAKGGFYNALQAIRHSQQERGGRLGTPRPQRITITPPEIPNVPPIPATTTDAPTPNIVFNEADLTPPPPPSWDNESVTKPTGSRNNTAQVPPGMEAVQRFRDEHGDTKRV